MKNYSKKIMSAVCAAVCTVSCIASVPAQADEDIEIISIPPAMGAAIIAENAFEKDLTVNEAGTLAYADGISINLKGNTARKKTENENGYLYWEKTLDADTHADCSFTTELNYMVTQCDARFENFGQTFYFYILRDNVSNTANADMYTITVDAVGNAYACGIFLGKLETGKWYNIATAWNMPERTFDVYINREPAAENIAFPNSRFITPRMVRLWMYGSDTISVNIDNYWIYEEKTPVYDIEEIESKMISVMSDGTRENLFLSGRTAISTANGISYINGKRKKNTAPVQRDGDWCVDKSLAIRLLGALPQEYSAYDEVPLKAAAELNGINVYEDADRYLLIFSQRAFSADDDLLDDVSAFMKMIVPTKEEIQSDFETRSIQHPRIIATADMWESIKGQISEDSEAAEWHRGIIADANALLAEEVDTYHYEVQENILRVARRFKNKMEKWGYAWRTTGDRKYANAAWEEIKAICEFPDWDPVHILDTGELLYGAAIGYDWMYDAWNEVQRGTVEEAAKRLGIDVIRSAYYGRLQTEQKFGELSGGTFVTGTTNFNVVANGGMTAACLAFADIYPEECFDGASKAIQSLTYMLPKFEPEGAWEEGPNYWNYTTDYLAKMVSVLETSCGTDYTIFLHPGVGQTPYYAMYLDSYQGVNNFSDTARGMKWDCPQMWCFGKYLNEKAFSYMRYNEIAERGCTPTLYDIIWHDDTAKTEKPVLSLDNTTKGVDLISIRGSWEDPDALYLSAHGGKNNVYHAQYDGGSFVFDLLGERWAVDLGMDEATYTGHKESDVYRGRAEGHNMLVFNPDMDEDFILQSYTRLTRFESADKGAIAVYDNSEGYSKWTDYVKRGFFVGDNRRSMTVRDEFAVSDENTVVYWNMQTPADISIDGNKAILTLNGKRLQVEVASNSQSFELLALKAEPLPGTPNPDYMAADTDNKLAIKLTPGSGECYIEVKMSPADEAAAQTGMLNMPIDEWNVSGLEYPEIYCSMIDDFTSGSTGFFTGAARSGSCTAVAGAGGKGGSDISLKMTSYTGYDGAMYIYASADRLIKPSIITFEVYPEDTANTILVTTDKGIAIAAVKEYDMVPYQWNRILINYNNEAGAASTVYLNGEKYAETKTKFANYLRLGFQAADALVSGCAYFDEIQIAYGCEAVPFADMTQVRLNGNMITGFSGTAGELKSLIKCGTDIVIKDNNGRELSDNEPVTPLSGVYFKDGDLIAGHCYVTDEEFFAQKPSVSIGRESVSTEARVTVLDSRPHTVTVIIAEYKNGVMLGCGTAQAEYTENGYYTVCMDNYAKRSSLGACYKAFIWESTDTLRPLSACAAEDTP